MWRKWLIINLIVFILSAFTGICYAWSGRADVNGKPDQLYTDGPSGYFIWKDDNGFHIWTKSGEEVRHQYSGIIRTDGNFFHVRGHRLESRDSFKVYSDIQESSWFKFNWGDRSHRFAFEGREVDLDRTEIRFKFYTFGGSDGLNFRIQDATFIEFDLLVDGHPSPAKTIYIGDRGWYPLNHKFRIYQQ